MVISDTMSEKNWLLCTTSLADFYALDRDNIGSEWRNFKYEVMNNKCPDDDWRDVLAVAAKRTEDWPNLACVAREQDI